MTGSLLDKTGTNTMNDADGAAYGNTTKKARRRR